MAAVLALAGKDLKLLVRDKVGLFFTGFFPILYASFFGMIFSGQGGDSEPLKVTVLDLDNTPDSQRFLEHLKAGGELNCTSVASEAAANDAVRRGRVVACIVLPAGFGERYARPFARGMAELELRVDPSRQAETGMLQGMLTGALFRGFQELMTDPNAMTSFIDDSLAELDAAGELDSSSAGALRLFLPALKSFTQVMSAAGGSASGGSGAAGWSALLEPKVVVTSVQRRRFGPKNAYEISFPQGIVWGMMGCAAGFGIALVQERTSGTLTRLRTSPIAPMQILAGKALACFLMTVLVASGLLAFGVAVFGVRPASWPLLGLAIFCSATMFVGIMQLLSVLGKTEQSAGGIGWAVLTVMAMLGGGMVPLFVMPGWMQQLASISPIKWVVYSLEGAMWRGFSVAEMITPCVILVVIGLVTFAIGTRAFALAEKR